MPNDQSKIPPPPDFLLKRGAVPQKPPSGLPGIPPPPPNLFVKPTLATEGQVSTEGGKTTAIREAIPPEELAKITDPAVRQSLAKYGQPVINVPGVTVTANPLPAVTAEQKQAAFEEEQRKARAIVAAQPTGGGEIIGTRNFPQPGVAAITTAREHIPGEFEYAKAAVSDIGRRIFSQPIEELASGLAKATQPVEGKLQPFATPETRRGLAEAFAGTINVALSTNPAFAVPLGLMRATGPELASSVIKISEGIGGVVGGEKGAEIGRVIGEKTAGVASAAPFGPAVVAGTVASEILDPLVTWALKSAGVNETDAGSGGIIAGATGFFAGAEFYKVTPIAKKLNAIADNIKKGLDPKDVAYEKAVKDAVDEMRRQQVDDAYIENFERTFDAAKAEDATRREARIRDMLARQNAMETARVPLEERTILDAGGLIPELRLNEMTGDQLELLRKKYIDVPAIRSQVETRLRQLEGKPIIPEPQVSELQLETRQEPQPDITGQIKDVEARLLKRKGFTQAHLQAIQDAADKAGMSRERYLQILHDVLFASGEEPAPVPVLGEGPGVVTERVVQGEHPVTRESELPPSAERQQYVNLFERMFEDQGRKGVAVEDVKRQIDNANVPGGPLTEPEIQRMRYAFERGAAKLKAEGPKVKVDYGAIIGQGERVFLSSNDVDAFVEKATPEDLQKLQQGRAKLEEEINKIDSGQSQYVRGSAEDIHIRSQNMMYREAIDGLTKRLASTEPGQPGAGTPPPSVEGVANPAPATPGKEQAEPRPLTPEERQKAIEEYDARVIQKHKDTYLLMKMADENPDVFDEIIGNKPKKIRIAGKDLIGPAINAFVAFSSILAALNDKDKKSIDGLSIAAAAGLIAASFRPATSARAYGKLWWNPLKAAEYLRSIGLRLEMGNFLKDAKRGLLGETYRPIGADGKQDLMFTKDRVELYGRMMSDPDFGTVKGNLKLAMKGFIGEHYSAVSSRTGEILRSVDPSFQGQGMAGAEKSTYEARAKKGVAVSYFYPKGTKPEAIVAGYQKYRSAGLINGIYDLELDPLALQRPDPVATEYAIKKAGFGGYAVRGTVAVFDPVDVIPVYGKTAPKIGEKAKTGIGVAASVAPYPERNVSTKEELDNEFVSNEYKGFFNSILSALHKYDLTQLRLNDAAGFWRAPDGKLINEPTTRIEFAESDARVDALAAEIGKVRDQNSVYLAKYGEQGKGYEYTINFMSPRGAYEASQRLPLYGIDGATIDMKLGRIIIGDQNNGLESNVRKFYQYAKEQQLAYKAQRSRADIQFLSDYDTAIESGRAEMARRSPEEGVGGDIQQSRTGNKGAVADEIISNASENRTTPRMKGADLVARGVTDRQAWDQEMVKSFGEQIRPQLDMIRKNSEAIVEQYLSTVGDKAPSLTRLLDLIQKGEDGREWYSKAYDELFKLFGVNAKFVAKLIGATSSARSVAVNVTLALRAYRQFLFGGAIDKTKFTSSQYDNIIRAIKDEPLQGRKVANFADALVGNKNAVVVDRWMSKVFFDNKAPTDAQYSSIETALKNLSKDLGMPASEIQARIWTAVKNEQANAKQYPATPIVDVIRKRLGLGGTQGSLFDDQWWRVAAGAVATGLPAIEQILKNNNHDKDGQGNLMESSLGGLGYMIAIGAAVGLAFKGLQKYGPKILGAGYRLSRSIKGEVVPFEKFSGDMEAMYGEEGKAAAPQIYDAVSKMGTFFEHKGFTQLAATAIENTKADLEAGKIQKEHFHRELRLNIEHQLANDPIFTKLSDADFDIVRRQLVTLARRAARDVEAPPESHLEVSIRNMTDNLNRELEQLKAIGETGTYQPKEIRPEFALGKEPPKSAVVSESIIEQTKSRIVAYGNELVRLKDMAEAENDPISAAALEVARSRYADIVAQWKIIRAVWGRSGHAFQRGTQEIFDIADNLNNIPLVKKRLPLLDQLLSDVGDTLVKLAGKEGSPRTATDKVKNAVDYLRVNLFTFGTWTLDLMTNGIAGGAHAMANLALDGMDLMKIGSAPRTLGLFNAIQRQVGGMIKGIGQRSAKEFYRLPDSIESALGHTTGGEFIGSMTAKKIGPVNLDYLVAPHIRAKGFVDRVFGRTFAMADLIAEGIRQAKFRGLEGESRNQFVNEFVQAQSDRTAAGKHAIKIGREVKFNRELSKMEEKFASSTGIKLLVDAFPRWSFQFGRWMGEMVGLDPVFAKKAFKGEAKAEDWADYLVKAATGWGGMYLVYKTLYPNVDFTSMTYRREDGDRVRLSGRAPIPDALFLLALLKGDFDNAQKALQYTSLPFSKIGTTSSGLLGSIFALFNDKGNAKITEEKLIGELENRLNSALPGQAVLSFFESLHDPAVREGIGSNIPYLSEVLANPVINPTTGLPMERFQRIPFINVELPAAGGVPFPGAVIIYNPLEQEFLDHGIGLRRPQRTDLPAYSEELVAESEKMAPEIRRQFEVLAGQYVEEFGFDLIDDPSYSDMTWDQQTYFLGKVKSRAIKQAKLELVDATGNPLPRYYGKDTEKQLPEVIRQRIETEREDRGIYDERFLKRP